MPDLSPEALSGSGLVFENMTTTEVTGTIGRRTRPSHTVGSRAWRPYATAVESTTSVGASLAVADEAMFAVGLTNQTDFIRAHTEGRLHVKAWPIHQGRTGQLWQCDITREDGKTPRAGTRSPPERADALRRRLIPATLEALAAADAVPSRNHRSPVALPFSASQSQEQPEMGANGEVGTTCEPRPPRRASG